jgi:4-amino-4-deoxy-L-arabinose transferase-like glycosyltransferase
MAKKRNRKRDDKRNARNRVLLYALLLMVALSFRVNVARLMPNDTPDDGKMYAQMARNLLEQHVYSDAFEPPYQPTLIRLPGYPLFLAGIYSVFGHGDNSAVRVVQALLDTASCAMVSLIAFFWEPDERLKRRTSIAALALAALCPFTTIYVATILTETAAIFFAVAMCLTATLAFKVKKQRHALLLWAATGLVAGTAVLFRPDSGLFAAAIGITLVVATLARSAGLDLSNRKNEVIYRLSRASYLGATFSLAFCLALAPWAIRNHRLFHLFQPLAPAHAEMPGEFVPRGYLAWVRTWIDDPRYIEPALWSVDARQIKLENIPDRAFDSAAEKQRVAALLEKYNHRAEEVEASNPSPELQASPTPSEDQLDQNQETDSTSEGDESAQDKQAGEDNTADGGDEGDAADQVDENAPADQATDQSVEMTPEIDAGFAEIARERIGHHPVRYYFLLPVKRAFALWFDTHSQYYPFEGDLLPLDDLDYDIHQQFWLPLFAILTFLYTLFGIVGGWFLWATRSFISRQWLLLATLMIVLRLAFFSTLENPEPRYVVEIFPFLSILGGIALARLGGLRESTRL